MCIRISVSLRHLYFNYPMFIPRIYTQAGYPKSHMYIPDVFPDMSVSWDSPLQADQKGGTGDVSLDP